MVTVHNHVMYRDDISRFTKWRYRIVERGLSHYTSKIIAVSDSLREELVDAYGISPSRIVTILNGVDTGRFLEVEPTTEAKAAYRIAPDHLVVGLAVRFAPQKDLFTFIDAVAEVCSRRCDVEFLLGGDGPLKSDLEAAVRAKGLDGRLHMIGFVDDMPSFLSALDVYVSSSLSEGLPLTFVEVGAAGLPIVATDAGGTGEIVRDGVNGILVPAADPPALARGIERLLDESGLRARLGTEGRRIAATEFTPEVMMDKTIAAYREAMAGV